MIRIFMHGRVGKAKRAHLRALQVGTARSLSSGRPKAGPVGAFAHPTLIAFLGLAAPAFAQTAPPSPAPPRQHISIGYVEIEGDPRYEPIRAYERLVLKTRGHPFPGAQIGIDEAAALVRVLNTEFALERITVKSPAEVAPAVTQALEGRGIHFFLIDAPAEAFKAL